MAKLFTYIFISIGLMLLFRAAGLNTTGSAVLSFLGADLENPTNFFFGTLVGLVTSAIASFAVVGVIMGIFGRTFSDVPITATFATPLVGLLADTASIITLGGTGWVGTILILIILPLTGGYFLALYDWVRGRD